MGWNWNWNHNNFDCYIVILCLIWLVWISLDFIKKYIEWTNLKPVVNQINHRLMMFKETQTLSSCVCNLLLVIKSLNQESANMAPIPLTLQLAPYKSKYKSKCPRKALNKANKKKPTKELIRRMTLMKVTIKYRTGNSFWMSRNS